METCLNVGNSNLTCLYYNHPVALFAGFGVLIAFGAALISWRHLRLNLILAIQKNSIDFEKSYTRFEPVVESMNMIQRFNKQDVIDIVEIDKKLRRGEKISRTGIKKLEAVRLTLNEWEAVANAVRYNVYDEEYLFSIYCATVKGMYTILYPYINYRQLQNPRLFVNFQLMSTKWMLRRNSETKRKDFKSRLWDAQELLTKSENSRNERNKLINLQNGHDRLKKIVREMY